MAKLLVVLGVRDVRDASPTGPQNVELGAASQVTIENATLDTDGLTDAELRASSVPVSGPLTDAQLRAATVPVTDTSVAVLSKNAGNTDATTIRVVTAADGPLNTAIGGANDAKVDTDAVGSVSSKLRGLVAMAKAWTRGAGAVSAETLRTTLASDDPAVTTLGAKADATWDGAAVASGISIWRYLGTKLEAIRALLAGSLTVNAVTLAAAENHIGEIGSPLITPSANFTRPTDTTAYASGDLVANNVTAGSVAPLSWTAARIAAGSFLVRRVRLKKSTTTTTNASFRVHFYAVDPSASTGISNGDNSAWLTKSTTAYLGSMDVTVDKVFSDGAMGHGIPATGSEMSVKLASGQTLYALLEARAAYGPGNAEVFTVDVELFQN